MNKLWNACRFVSMNKPVGWDENFELNNEHLNLPDKWIFNRLNRTIKNYNQQLERFRFNEAAKIIYDFVWNDFCDWYIEFAKTRFYSENEQDKITTYDICVACIRKVLL